MCSFSLIGINLSLTTSPGGGGIYAGLSGERVSP